MISTITTLLTSKRFLVSALATGAAVYLCATGKIPADRLAQTITTITVVLTASYGIENAAAAHGASFPDPPAKAQSVIADTTTCLAAILTQDSLDVVKADPATPVVKK